MHMHFLLVLVKDRARDPFHRRHCTLPTRGVKLGACCCVCAQDLYSTPRPLLSALHSSHECAAAPLETLRIQDLSQSLTVLRDFAGTLRHLMLPELPWITAYSLPNIVKRLTALEVRDCFKPEAVTQKKILEYVLNR